MRTVKLVVIGDSGVGKTSLRGQVRTIIPSFLDFGSLIATMTKYVSGRFSTGYRATIGTDFIAKTLPHHSNPDESVTLQIWVRPSPSPFSDPTTLTWRQDTAGQERFSSLSTAFFRGADAALLMFDVNQPTTLHALTRWWSEFRACAPLADEDMEGYCLVVVGNKTDLISSSDNATVSEEDALRFIDELVPPSETRSSSPATPVDERDWIPARVASGSDDEICAHRNGNLNPDTSEPEEIILVDETSAAVGPRISPEADCDPEADTDTSVPTIMIPPRTASIDLSALHHKRSSKSHSRNSQFSLAPHGTMSSTHTGFTSFHTPASSFSDGHEPYISAPSSPLSHSRSRSSSPLLHAHRSRPRRSLSSSTISISTAPTITPARYATAQALARTMPPRPPHGPKLFFTSAKTGAGVSDVFAYIAQRVVMRWEWEEARADASTGVGNSSTVGLDEAVIGQKKAFRTACCSS
jgi:Ras-related protein Rab-7A